MTDYYVAVPQRRQRRRVCVGLNAVSDGVHVVHPLAATGFAAQLRDAGFQPVGADLSELLKGGGSIKCCTLEVHP